MADFPIVGIGSSAGGLEALQKLFGAMPPDSGLAFVVAAHLDPTHESHLSSLLSRCTKMPVAEVENSIRLEPNHVYVIAPDQELTIRGGVLHTNKPTAPRGHRHPVDSFFRSLAEDQGERAIAIVLSGTGTNGSLGLRFIKAEGGIVIAQDPDTAGFGGMPRSAIATGIVDLVLPPERMPEALLSLARHPYVRQPAETVVEQTPDEQLHTLLTLVRSQSKRDFGSYKKRTLLRRIQRRMGLHRIEGLPNYIERLRTDPDEMKALAADLTINVTGFFRDPDAWKTLSGKVIAPLVQERPPDSTIRVWVPGCSTGEEAYSIAMLITEHAEAASKTFDARLFATDVAEGVLVAARAGSYPASIAQDLTPERLERWFEVEEDTYCVKQTLRDMITFAPQNLLQDPPFSRIDLISCRNLLIYIEPGTQKRLLGLFHFALREGGHLFLGPAETITGYEELFAPVSRKCRIYRRVGPTRHDLVDFPLVDAVEGAPAGAEPPAPPEPRVRAGELMDRALLKRYAPASVLIDQHFRVLYLRGPTEDYLRPPRGEPSYNLIDMAREGLPSGLRAAVRTVIEKGQEAAATARVRRGGASHPVQFVVAPLRFGHDDGVQRLLVSFFEREASSEPDQPLMVEEPTSDGQLQADLDATRDDLRLTIEQMDTANEELKASNEEIRSINEELQASNEELETSKEELQSLNEELNTVNNQLQAKVGELEARTDDLNNLLNSSDVATLFLDRSLCIRWFTPSMKALLELLPTDVGRPISHFAQRFKGGDLLDDAGKVLERLLPSDTEVVDELGRWYIRHIVPYRTASDRIDGVVVTFVDISERKRREKEVEDAKEFAEAIVEAVRFPLVVLTPELQVQSANAAFYDTFQVAPDETLGRPLVELGNRQWRIPQLQQLLKKVLPERSEFADLEMEHEFEQIGRRTVLLHARPLNGTQLILLGMVDITERKRIEAAARESEERLRAVLRHMPIGVIVAEAPSGRLLLSNDQVARIWGHPFKEATDVGGYEAYRGFHSDGRPYQAEEWPLARSITAGEVVEGEEIDFERGDGEHGMMSVSSAPIRAADGRIVAGVVAFFDLTARRRAEAALERSEERFRQFAENSSDVLWIVDLDAGRLEYLSPAYEKIWGEPRDAIMADFGRWTELVHPEDREQASQAMPGIGRGEPAVIEYRIVRPCDGEIRWIRDSGFPIRDEHGDVRRAAGLARDVTARKRVEAERELLLRELSHRVRNVLAVVQALALQTDDSDSVEDYRDKFVGRLSALSRAHSMLLDAQWRSADLKELVELALQAYRVDHPDTIKIDGGSVPLAPHQGLGLSLVLHELGTNAVKHGALSHHQGRLRVAWQVKDGEQSRRVRLRWEEQGGSEIKPPAKKGFGTRLIERACTHELEGEVELDYAPGGLRCEIDFPLA